MRQSRKHRSIKHASSLLHRLRSFSVSLQKKIKLSVKQKAKLSKANNLRTVMPWFVVIMLVLFSLLFVVYGVFGQAPAPSPTACSGLTVPSVQETGLSYRWLWQSSGPPYTLKYWIDEGNDPMAVWDEATATVNDGSVYPAYQANWLFSQTTYKARLTSGSCPSGTEAKKATGNTDCSDWLDYPQVHYVKYTGTVVGELAAKVLTGEVKPNTCDVMFNVFAVPDGSCCGLYGNYYRVSPAASPETTMASPVARLPSLPAWQVNAPAGPITWQFEYDDGKAGCDLDYGFRYKYDAGTSGFEPDQLRVFAESLRKDAASDVDVVLYVSALSPKCTLKFYRADSPTPYWVYSGTSSGLQFPTPSTPPKLIDNADPGMVGARLYEVDFCGDSEVTTNEILSEQCDPPGSACTDPSTGQPGECSADCSRCEKLPCPGPGCTPCTDNDNDGYSLEGGICGTVDCDDTDSAINSGYSNQDGLSVTGGCNGVDNDCDGLVDEEYPIYSCGGIGCSGNLYCSTQSKSCTSPALGCKLGSGTETCRIPPALAEVIYGNSDCGVCCKCTAGDAKNPAWAYDEAQDIDCATAACNNPPGACNNGCGANIYGVNVASETKCAGKFQCMESTCSADCSIDTDADNDGYSPKCGDCDDVSWFVNPGSPDAACDGVDNDCDGVPDDEYSSPGPVCNKDCSGDGFNNCVNGAVVCQKNPAVVCPCAGGIGC